MSTITEVGENLRRVLIGYPLTLLSMVLNVSVSPFEFPKQPIPPPSHGETLQKRGGVGCWKNYAE
ncbi:MAG: hypothetical protein EXS25_08265 [Pedosphaera sp.]|nr:hypothetical protein [Pedosphaera sp.]